MVSSPEVVYAEIAFVWSVFVQKPWTLSSFYMIVKLLLLKIFWGGGGNINYLFVRKFVTFGTRMTAGVLDFIAWNGHWSVKAGHGKEL